MQIGAYTTQENASLNAQILRNAGFVVSEERSGGLFRVSVVNIPASVVHLAVQRLGALGVRQIWVKE
ncbi:MAG: hypothetical protein FWF55_08290 [Treponema sp.]|nr:hypothetical protein [Treponema sp.]